MHQVKYMLGLLSNKHICNVYTVHECEYAKCKLPYLFTLIYIDDIFTMHFVIF